tara:strand:- start:2136 stop:2879 length:744 start_codon:yes stop_codon:yes gene_type:complete
MSYSFNTKIKFWREIFSFQSFNTKDEWIDYLPKFKNHCDIVFTYIANFDDIKLSNLTQYFVDILAETSGKCDELFNEVLQFMMFLQKEQIRMHTETFKEHEYIVKKIKKSYTKNGMGQKLHCPIDEYILSKNFIQLNEQDKNDPYVILWELRKQMRVYHYYIMMYVHDLSLKLHILRNEIIKYDLARGGKISGTPLDIIINENVLCYMELNKELCMYSKKMNNHYYSNHSCMYPENNYMNLPIYYMA